MFNLIFSTLFMNSSISPKVYIALTGISSLLSGLLLVLEWWHYNKYGTSFLENFSLQQIGYFFGLSAPPPSDSSNRDNSNFSDSESNSSIDSLQHDCQVSENPYRLFRGAEYNLYEKGLKKPGLTFYDMNLSSSDHQALFPQFVYNSNEEFELMQQAWRERDRKKRMSLAQSCLSKNAECVPGMFLVAEEGESNMVEVEKRLKECLRCAELRLNKKKAAFAFSGEEEQAREFDIVLAIKRRLALAQRKLGKYKEAIKIMKDMLKEIPLAMDIHENLLECYLESRAYADVQAVMAKYDDVNYPKSATIVYTAALIKCRAISDKYSAESLIKRHGNVSAAELSAVEAIQRAVEFNPHVPKYLLEEKPLVLPPEHIVRRGDSEALAYAFFHIDHWKRVDGALQILQLTWEQTFRSIPSNLSEGHSLFFHAYPNKGMEAAERELLPAHHELSVYPKRELSTFVAISATLCSLSAIAGVLYHSNPEAMSSFFASMQHTAADVLGTPAAFFFDKVQGIIPAELLSNLARF